MENPTATKTSSAHSPSLLPVVLRFMVLLFQRASGGETSLPHCLSGRSFGSLVVLLQQL